MEEKDSPDPSFTYSSVQLLLGDQKVNKMDEKSRIRVAVLEGDYANLCGLGLPPSLCLQLQTLKLRLSGALWTAKASASGFSISLYRPTTGTAPEKEKAKKTRRKRRKHNRKVTSNSNSETILLPDKPPESVNKFSVPIDEPNQLF